MHVKRESCFWHVTEIALGLKRLMLKTSLEGILVEPVNWNLEQTPLFSEPYAHLRVFQFAQHQPAKQVGCFHSREW